MVSSSWFENTLNPKLLRTCGHVLNAHTCMPVFMVNFTGRKSRSHVSISRLKRNHIIVKQNQKHKLQIFKFLTVKISVNRLVPFQTKRSTFRTSRDLWTMTTMCISRKKKNRKKITNVILISFLFVKYIFWTFGS